MGQKICQSYAMPLTSEDMYSTEKDGRRHRVSSTKEYRDFTLEQLSEVPNVACRPMMGEFLPYSNRVLFSGIYDDRLLVKIVQEKRTI